MRIGHYNLKIHYSQQKELHHLITDILGIVPSDAGNGEWNLHIRESDGEYVDFINVALDHLDGKYEALKNVGINRDNITVFRGV